MSEITKLAESILRLLDLIADVSELTFDPKAETEYLIWRLQPGENGTLVLTEKPKSEENGQIALATIKNWRRLNTEHMRRHQHGR